MKPSAIPAFLVALVASALVWGLSPLVTGHLEPWDADGLYYVAALTVTGIVTGSFFPRPLWAHYLGSVVGQLTYELIFLKLGPLFVIGIVFLLGYSVVFWWQRRSLRVFGFILHTVNVLTQVQGRTLFERRER